MSNDSPSGPVSVHQPIFHAPGVSGIRAESPRGAHSVPVVTYLAVQPPSTTRPCPVMYDIRPDASRAIASAMSSG